MDLTDPMSPAWVPQATMSVQRAGHVCHVVGDEVFVVGNFLGFGPAAEIFSLTTGVWRDGPDSILPRLAQPSKVAFEDSFLVIGGFDG